MEQSKFEKEFREKMHSREILPSENAWNRLEAMLNVTETMPQPKKRRLPWIGIAASFALLLGLGYFVTLPSYEIENKVEVVSQESNSGTSKLLNSKGSNQQEKVQSNPNTHESKSSNKNLYEKINAIAKLQKVKNSFESLDKSKKSESRSEREVVLTQNVIPVTINEEKGAASNEVVLTEKIEMQVDAQALLNQVEGEMKQTFRENIFKRIKKNYKNAKEVLVSRNQESSINH